MGYSTNETCLLQRWNSFYSDQYLLNTFIIAFGILIGLKGNPVVTYNYIPRRIKTNGHGRFFIRILATMNLICVSVSSTYSIQLSANYKTSIISKFVDLKIISQLRLSITNMFSFLLIGNIRCFAFHGFFKNVFGVFNQLFYKERIYGYIA